MRRFVVWFSHARRTRNTEFTAAPMKHMLAVCCFRNTACLLFHYQVIECSGTLRNSPRVLAAMLYLRAGVLVHGREGADEMRYVSLTWFFYRVSIICREHKNSSVPVQLYNATKTKRASRTHINVHNGQRLIYNTGRIFRNKDGVWETAGQNCLKIYKTKLPVIDC